MSNFDELQRALDRASGPSELIAALRAHGLDFVLRMPAKKLLKHADSVDLKALVESLDLRYASEHFTIELAIFAPPAQPFIRSLRKPLYEIARAYGPLSRAELAELPKPLFNIASLKKWASDNFAEDILGTPSRTVMPGLTYLPAAVNRSLGQVTVQDALTSREWIDRSLLEYLGQRGIKDFQIAVREGVETRGDRIRKGASDEAELLAQVKRCKAEPPARRALLEKVLVLREELRRESPPVPRVSSPIRIVRPIIATLTIPGGPETGTPMQEKLALDLAGWQTNALQIGLYSEPRTVDEDDEENDRTARTRVRHDLALSPQSQLTFIDAFIRWVLESAASSVYWSRLQQEPWERALEAVERAIENKGTDVEGEIRWVLRDEYGGWRLSPALFKRNAPSYLTVQELDARGFRARHSNERRAMDLLRSVESHDGSRPANPNGNTLVVGRALRLLADAVPILLAQRGDFAPLELVSEDVELEFVETADGKLEVKTRVGDSLLSCVAALLRFGEGPGDEMKLVREAGPRVRLTSLDALTRSLLRAFAENGARFPRSALPRILETFAASRVSISVQLPESLRGSERDPSDRTILRVAVEANRFLSVEVLAEPAEGVRFPPGQGPSIVSWSGKKRETWSRRDFDAEKRRAHATLDGLLLDEETQVAEFTHVVDLVQDGDRGLALISALDAITAENLVVEWRGEKARIGSTLQASQLKLSVRTASEWFALEGAVEVDKEQVSLAMLLDAYRSQRGFVQIKPGEFAQISDELRTVLARLDAVTRHEDGTLLLEPAAPLVLENVRTHVASLEVHKGYRRVLERVREAKEFEPNLSEARKAILRPYQVEGIGWLGRLSGWGAGAILADDMGLGKTIQVLTLLELRKADGPVLVIAPTSVGSNWVREAERHAIDLNVALDECTAAERAKKVESLGPGDVFVTSYALFLRYAEIFQSRSYAALVLDEAQFVKNADAQRTRAVKSIRAETRIALTGTPLENHLGELWSIFDIVFPGLLGSIETFRARYAIPIERQRSFPKRDQLREHVRPFILRRKKSDVLRELPPRTEILRLVDLESEEKKLYEQARLACVGQLQTLDLRGAEARVLVLAMLTKLRLCACHPRLYDPRSDAESSKLRMLVDYLVELRDEGHRVLVFSQFTKLLDLVEPALRTEGISFTRLDGSTPKAERTRRVDSFQRGEHDAFLLSLRAGGTGLNLTAASYVIHLDPWWNPAVEDQASDRAHRMGQTRPVTIVRLVARGTIEEKILSLHDSKRELVDALLEGTDRVGGLSTTDLAALVTQSPDPSYQ